MEVSNIYFSKIIKVGERLREFNFRKIPNTTNNFHVDVTDDRGQRHMFVMFKDEEGSWKTNNQQLPLWIYASEEMLGNIINEETVDL